MRGRFRFTLLFAALGIVAMPITANAIVVDWEIEVLVNTVSQGTASSAGPILDVTVNAGDTVRFIAGVSALGTGTLTTYTTSVTADDPLEIDYTINSAVDLTGLGFTSGAQPNATLNDTNPDDGQVNANAGAVAQVLDLYRLDYVVQAGVDSTAGVDFTVRGIIVTTGGDTATTGTARVRLNAGVGIPEPGTILLLGSGLAAMAGFGRRRARR
ncbi:MAG: PEP-CTERM sorting domain-containing protein [Deltaproteobacteria bacterium]|nr:PEP-CTERM sorting domain-containing protein [Deltaproteobacteria bacterium]